MESCTPTAATAADDAQMPSRARNSSSEHHPHQQPVPVPGRSAPPGRRLAGDGRSTWSAPTIRRQPEYRQVNYDRDDSVQRPPAAAASAHLLMMSLVTCSWLAVALLHINLT